MLDADVLARAETQRGALAHQLTPTLGRSTRAVSRARQRGVLVDVAPVVVARMDRRLTDEHRFRAES